MFYRPIYACCEALYIFFGGVYTNFILRAKTKNNMEQKSIDSKDFNLKTQLTIKRVQPAYHRWIHADMQPFLGTRILEIGSGVGNQTKHLLVEKPELLVASDIHDEMISYLQKNFKQAIKQKKMLVEYVDVDDEKSINKMKKYKLDTITSVNVLEHIKNDTKALKACYDILQPGGRIIMEMPAHQELYSKLDEKLGHYRRYEKKDLIRKVKKAGFTVKKIFYFNSVGYIVWYLKFKFFGAGDPGEGNMALFDKFVPFFKFFDKYIVRKKIGNILIVVGEK